MNRLRWLCSLASMLGMMPTALYAGTDPTSSPFRPFAGEPAAVWASGYAAYVQHFCPGWDVDTDALMHAGADPLPENFSDDAEWGQNGRYSVALRQGAAEAERLNLADPGFCHHPLASLREPNKYVRLFLRPKRDPT